MDVKYFPFFISCHRLSTFVLPLFIVLILIHALRIMGLPVVNASQ